MNTVDNASLFNLDGKIARELGAVDILVNNAAVIKRVPLTEMRAEDFRRVVDGGILAYLGRQP